MFSNDSPPFVKMYRISELDGTPTNVVDNLNLMVINPDESGFDRFMAVIRVPPASGFAFAGRVLSLGNSGRVRVTPYIG